MRQDITATAKSCKSMNNLEHIINNSLKVLSFNHKNTHLSLVKPIVTQNIPDFRPTCMLLWYYLRFYIKKKS